MTLAEYKTNRERIQTEIFDFAKNRVSLTPHLSAGSGHVHIDSETGFPRAQDVSNFVTDWNNHFGLALGALGNNAPNAPLALYHDDQRKGYEEALSIFNRIDQGESLQKVLPQEERWKFANEMPNLDEIWPSDAAVLPLQVRSLDEAEKNKCLLF